MIADKMRHEFRQCLHDELLAQQGNSNFIFLKHELSQAGKLSLTFPSEICVRVKNLMENFYQTNR
jgi:hypothetical protein